MSPLFRKALAVAALAMTAASTTFPDAIAASLPTCHVLTPDIARRVLAAAEAEARQRNWPGVIAIVDAEGYLITMDRMDGSPMLASVELAPAKARTAALFDKPSKVLEDAIHAGRVAATTSGFVEMVGGLPLVVDGEEVGAIGVSTAQPDWDSQIAAAGAASLSKQP
jgi:glc operon protein GlcG